jgi:hypothetical protein
METQFRKLGLPTQLYDGKVRLLANHTVCREGVPLSADQAQVLRPMKVQRAKFEIQLKAIYDKESAKVTAL